MSPESRLYGPFPEIRIVKKSSGLMGVDQLHLTIVCELTP